MTRIKTGRTRQGGYTLRALWLACIFTSMVMASPTLAGLPPSTEVELPDTPAASRLVELLDRLQSGSREALMDYALKYFTPEMLQPTPESIVDFLFGISQSTGGYEVRQVLESVDEQITVLVQGRSDTNRWAKLIVGAEAEPPYRVRGLFTYRAPAALASEPDDPILESELPQRLEALVDRLAAEDDFSGTVCLSKGREFVLNKAWGWADRETQRPNTIETPFSIASTGKVFTAVAIAQLAEAGKLSYNGLVKDVTPDWLGAGTDSVTIEQLLTHTSGLGDYLGPAMEDPSREYARLEDYKAIALADTPQFRPGERFAYSNTGFLLLGAVIERVSQVAWDEYLRTAIFEPAGMTNTGAYRDVGEDSAVAIGYYLPTDDTWAPNTPLVVGQGTSAGGNGSTAEDLVRFCHALLDGKLVSPASVDWLTTAQHEMPGTGSYYGRGFVVSAGEPGERVIGHGGGFPGFSSLLEIHEESGYILAVLANQRSAQQVGEAFRGLLKRRSEEPSR